MKLFHISGWQELASMREGDVFTLRPGNQNAEGLGVYFSESEPRASSCAEGTHKSGVTAIIAIEASDNTGWWQSKAAKARKFGKPRTWHSDRKHVLCSVQSKETGEHEGTPVCILHCTWQFVA